MAVNRARMVMSTGSRIPYLYWYDAVDHGPLHSFHGACRCGSLIRGPPAGRCRSPSSRCAGTAGLTAVTGSGAVVRDAVGHGLQLKHHFDRNSVGRLSLDHPHLLAGNAAIRADDASASVICTAVANRSLNLVIGLEGFRHVGEEDATVLPRKGGEENHLFPRLGGGVRCCPT